jgi:hypothetical protein
MPDLLTDAEINSLIAEPKPLPDNFQERLRLRHKRGHKEADLDLIGTNESRFRLILRQSIANHLDFSIILAYQPPQSNVFFRLRRYNGKSHEHTNHLEKETFYDFHIHYATQRYQEAGADEEVYATPTDRYSDIVTALDCLLTDCAFIIPNKYQPPLL